jgi:acyl carrier protein
MKRKRLKAKVEKIINDVSEEEKEIGISEETELYEDELSLDSLDVATLSVRLEEEFGKDPYTEAQKNGDSFPEKVGDILDFYRRQK